MASGQRFLKREARRAAKGFTLMEVMIATLLLLVGLVAAAELVPVAVTRNTQSRNDSKAAVVAEQVMDQILSQPLSTTIATITVDGLPFATGIGGPGAGAAGSPIGTGTGGQIVLTGAAAVPGFGFVLFDPANPSSPPIEVRVGVITTVAGGGPVSKRFVVSAWRRDPTQDPINSQVALDGFKQR